jgi:FdhE protein
MESDMSTPQTIDILSSVTTPPGILLPDPATLFAARRTRFKALSSGHALGDWLDYLGLLTQSQHDLLQSFGDQLQAESMPSQEAGYDSALPLDARTLARPPLWIELAKRIASDSNLFAASLEPMRERLRALKSMSPEGFETMAAALLDDEQALAESLTEALPEHVIVGASLQIVWTARAARLDASAMNGMSGRLADKEHRGRCPCCGSLPVASIVRASPQVNNLRYLHCSLCNTEWNAPRAVCTVCASDQAVAYRHIEQCGDAVRAECCDQCRSYLKVMMQEKEANIDPVADDLASIALDMLLDEAGYARSGSNPLLLCASA